MNDRLGDMKGGYKILHRVCRMDSVFKTLNPAAPI
jgi:hypothetical protein